jgi:hypothetical protein
MAAIDIADCTVTMDAPLAGFNVWTIVTPATADDADTIDISSIIDTAKIVAASCQAATDGWLPVAAIATTGALTIPGSTDNEARTIYVMGRNA